VLFFIHSKRILRGKRKEEKKDATLRTTMKEERNTTGKEQNRKMGLTGALMEKDNCKAETFVSVKV
jgi:hypothetical protein